MSNNYFAALDIGTNSFHLIIVKVDKNHKLKIIDKEREVIRLGSHEGKDLNFISKKETEQSIKVLKKFKKLTDHYKTEMRAVATSAVREAENKKEFIKKVLDETGIKIEVIDGTKEAKLIYIGAEKALNLKDEKVLCVDIGGGSTEFIFSDKGNITFAESIKIGAVRLTKKFFHDYIITDERIKNCSDYIEEQIVSNKKINLKSNFKLAVGSSGTIEAAATMINFMNENKPPKELNGFIFNKEDLKESTNYILEKKSTEERLLIRGMEEKRADIIPAGLIILNKIFELFKIKKMTISDYALREGIIFDTISKLEK